MWAVIASAAGESIGAGCDQGGGRGPCTLANADRHGIKVAVELFKSVGEAATYAQEPTYPLHGDSGQRCCRGYAACGDEAERGMVRAGEKCFARIGFGHRAAGVTYFSR